MKHLDRRGRLGWITALTIALAWSVQGAPIISKPQKINLPDEVLSLAGINQIQLTISDLPKTLQARGLKKSELHTRITRRLAMEEIYVLNDPSLPRMDVWFKQLGDPGRRDAVAFASVVAVFQSVRIHRLDRDMTVPTACFAGGTLLGREKLLEDIVSELVRKCGNIARGISLAKIPE